MSAISLTAEIMRGMRDFGLDHAESTVLAPTPPPAPIGPAVDLPAPAPVPEVDLATVLRHRRAVRFYAPRPLAAATLHSAVLAGFDADRRRWPQEHACCPLVPVVVAQNVAGLPPAVYRLDDFADQAAGTAGTGWRAASPVMVLDGPDSYEQLTLQREFAGAGAIVSILGDLERAERCHGVAGYRALMARAGAAAYQMWLTAIAHGVAGSVFAGFLPAAVRLPLGCDGVNRHQLFALALGYPAGEPESSAGGAPADPVAGPR